MVTDEDFIGSYYQVEYVIHKEKLKKGCQFGEIIVKSPYQQLVYQITASMEPQVQLKTEIMSNATAGTDAGSVGIFL